MKMKTFFLLALLPAVVGCNGVKRLTGFDDKRGDSTPQAAPVGDLNAHPFYDQSTATQAQDNLLIAAVIGNTSTADFQAYIKEPWLIDRMNGISGMGANTKPFSSLLVDAWKALFRRGYVNSAALKDPSIITSNVYPVPVYQDDATRWGL